MLVATLFRNLLLLDSNSSQVALDDLCRQQNRNLTAKAAPPNGLILLGADFLNSKSFIES